MKTKSILVFVTLVLISISGTVSLAATVSFCGLGNLTGGSLSYAYAVSANGSVVVGHSNTASGWEAFRWTSRGGMVGLGDLPGGAFHGIAWGVSADGSVIVGQSDSASGEEAFRWTSSGGMVGLGYLPVGDFRSVGRDVSADGSVVVGASGGRAVRWTSADGMVYLGDGEAFGVSADGSVIVGMGSRVGGAFRWTSAGGMVGLGDLPGGDFSSDASGVSADGSVVVGSGWSALGQDAFIWDSEKGIRSLKDELTDDYGLVLTDWQLLGAKGISADGLTIVGWGINPSGYIEGWVATVPEPATLLLLGLGAVMLRRKRS